MKKSYFSSTYKNPNNLKNSLIFIKEFKQNLIRSLEKELNLLYVDTPRLTKLSNDSNLRNINFDNKSNNLVYEFVYFPCKFLNKILDQLDINDNIYGLISSYERYNRDSIVSSTEFMTQNVIDIRINTIEDSFEEVCKQFYSKIISIMTKVANSIENKYSDLIIIKDSLSENYNIQNMNSFFKIYQTLKIDDYIKQKVIDNQHVLFTNTKKSKTNLFFRISDYDHDVENGQLLYYYSISHQLLNLMQVALSKGEDNKYLHITINIDLIIMTLLGKYHIAEVIPGSWDQSFEKEASKKKVEIL